MVENCADAATVLYGTVCGENPNPASESDGKDDDAKDGDNGNAGDAGADNADADDNQTTTNTTKIPDAVPVDGAKSVFNLGLPIALPLFLIATSGQALV